MEGTSELKILDKGNEVARYKYFIDTGRLVESTTHGGKPIHGISKSAMDKIIPQLEDSINKIINKVVPPGGVQPPRVNLPKKTGFPSQVGGAIIRVGSVTLSALLTVVDAPAAHAPGVEGPFGLFNFIIVDLPESTIAAMEQDGVKPIIVENPNQQTIQNLEDQAENTGSCKIEIRAEAKLDP